MHHPHCCSGCWAHHCGWLSSPHFLLEEILLYRSGFVCLFQFGAAARYMAKRAMPAEGCMGCILRRPACNYLPCGRKTCEVSLGLGTETPFLFNALQSPIAGKNTLKCSKTTEGNPGSAPRGPAYDYIPALWPRRYIPPDILDQGTATPFYLLSFSGSVWHFGLYKILQTWTREHLDGLVEYFALVDTL